MTQPAHQPAGYQYRITKFDPANRDPAGHYLAEDWHLHSQIFHFGWDFYMYVGAPQPCEAALEYARSLNLFPEVFTSPYHPEEA